MILTPLAKDEKLWSDRDVRLVKIPAKFKDWQFTQAKAHGLTLRFRVLSDGLVYMGCSERWGSTAAPNVAKDFATAETLKKAGWTHVVDDIFAPVQGRRGIRLPHGEIRAADFAGEMSGMAGGRRTDGSFARSRLRTSLATAKRGLGSG